MGVVRWQRGPRRGRAGMGARRSVRGGPSDPGGGVRAPCRRGVGGGCGAPGITSHCRRSCPAAVNRACAPR